MTSPGCYFAALHIQIKVANTPVCANAAAQYLRKRWTVLAAQSKPYRVPWIDTALGIPLGLSSSF